jgi:hypothetical protein
MPTPSLSDETILKTLRAYRRNKEDTAKTSIEIERTPLTVQRHLTEAEARGLALGPIAGVEFPEFDDDDIPIDQIIDHMHRRTDKAIARQNQNKWFSFKIKSNDPIAIAWVGDPHLGVGCNWTLLKRDIEIMKTTPGMYAANLGDTVDNWSRRLMHVWAEKDISKKTEQKLAKWFLKESGVPWLLWCEGNHDVMDGEFATYLRTINANVVPMLEWRAQFKLVFPNGRECLIDASHDHKGHSMWNELHGQMRVAQGSEAAHIIVAGHRHTWGISQVELGNNMVCNLLRARGYKWVDEYRVRHQFDHQNAGATVVTIIDPQAESEEDFVMPVANVQRAARILEGMRES